MTMRCVRLILMLPAAFALGGCASLMQRPEAPDGDKCLALYAQVDARVAQAGVRDASYHRLDDFPYLRTDRYTASFAREIPDMDAFWEWVGYLRANEDAAREVELRNMDLTREQASSLLLDLRACGGWLRSWELEDPAFRELLIEGASRVPDEYSTLRRAIGLYPLTRSVLSRDIEARREQVMARFAEPLQPPPAPTELWLWKARPLEQPEYLEGTIDLREKPRDLLGRIGLLWSEVVHLAHTHAPALWIETAGDYDRPGLPVHTPAGPDVDVRQPVVYFLPGLTRFGGRSLLQMNYLVWFSERPAAGPDDPAAGVLDGLIWRVTLDEQGRPLMYDSLPASGGSRHYGFPVQPMQRRAEADAALLFAQQSVPEGSVALRLRSGTHELVRVSGMAQATAGKSGAYELRSYEELLNLPHPDGGTRSLFGEQGIVVGSERHGGFARWSSGVPQVGAMRQWGHHPTTLVGRGHFDDPYLLEKLFVPPVEARPADPDDPSRP